MTNTNELKLSLKESMITEKVKIFVTTITGNKWTKVEDFSKKEIKYTKVEMIESDGSYREVNEAVKNIVDQSFHCNDVVKFDWQYV